MAFPQTVAALAPLAELEIASGNLTFADPGHRDFAMHEAGLGFDMRLEDLLKSKTPDRDDIRSIAREFISTANAEQVRQVALASKKKAPPAETTAALLVALEPIGRRAEFSLEKDIARLITHLDSKNDAIVTGAARALGAWTVTKAVPQLAAIAADEKRSIDIRRAASVALGFNGRPEAVAELDKLAAANRSITLRYLATEGLVAAGVKIAASATASLFREDPKAADIIALITAFTTHNNGARDLANSLKGTAIHPTIVKTIATHQRHTGSLPANLANFFQPATSGVDLLAALLAEKATDLARDVDARGDPAKDEAIYRRRESACTSCHAIDGVGPKIGPDLVAVGAATTTDYIVESILYPDKSIAEHYETVAITLADGGLRMGVIHFQSDEKILMHDATQPGVEIEIPADTAVKIKPMPSLMPPGLAAQLGSRQDFLDLAEFISQLGRPGNYAPSVAPVTRTWSLTGTDKADVPDDALWLPLYSKVDGSVPATDLGASSFAHLRGEIEVLKQGPIQLDLNDATGLRLWVDDNEIKDLVGKIHLTEGPHTFTFQLDTKKRPNKDFRVELRSKTAKFQLQTGI